VLSYADAGQAARHLVDQGASPVRLDAAVPITDSDKTSRAIPNHLTNGREWLWSLYSHRPMTDALFNRARGPNQHATSSTAILESFIFPSISDSLKALFHWLNHVAGNRSYLRAMKLDDSPSRTGTLMGEQNVLSSPPNLLSYHVKTNEWASATIAMPFSACEDMFKRQIL